jgi:DDE_Tnp_1-associated
MQFTPFLTLLAEIEDPRRAEGKLYRLPHVVLFAILAMVAGANSYRSIHSFVDVNFVRLRLRRTNLDLSVTRTGSCILCATAAAATSTAGHQGCDGGSSTSSAQISWSRTEKPSGDLWDSDHPSACRCHRNLSATFPPMAVDFAAM